MSIPAHGQRVDVAVRDNREQHRYEAYVGAALAGWSDYHEQPGLVTVMHTEVDRAFEGMGIGAELVRGMLDDIRRRDARVLAVCPFVSAYLRRHPEYADLVWTP